MRRSPRVSVLNVALLRLRRKPLCGLASDENLPFLNRESERISRSLLRAQRAYLKMANLLTVEDSLLLAAGIFNWKLTPVPIDWIVFRGRALA